MTTANAAASIRKPLCKIKMNKYIYCFYLFFALIFRADAQNLIRNGSFEQFYSCPNFYHQIDTAMFWTSPRVPSSSEYYNACCAESLKFSVPNNLFAYQFAHDGVAYAGIYLWINGDGGPGYREYVEGELTTPLISNRCYSFEMFVNLANLCQYTTDAIGVYFSDTLITGISYNTPLPFLPSISNTTGNFFDTLNWTSVSANYVAHGGEKYLIIGNFKNDANTTLKHISNPPGDFQVYVLVDDVSLTYSECTTVKEAIDYFIKLYPNPFNDIINIEISSNEKFVMYVQDIYGRIISRYLFSRKGQMNTYEFPKGIYFYEIKKNEIVIQKGKLIKE